MSENNKTVSPLRYPGSKRLLASYIRDVLVLNNLSPNLYIEPFAGGASVALKLMLDDKVEQVILMDLDPYIAFFWDVVFFDTDWLLKKIESIEVSIEKWHKYKKMKPKTKRDYALACLFLNRTSFSGIMRDEIGPLGGREQKSQYKIDCRFPKTKLIQRISTLREVRKKIFAIWPYSWENGFIKISELQKTGKLPTKDLFIYLDPPFFEKANKLYRYYFNHEDHIKLRDFLIELEESWLLSYDSAPQVEKLYGDAIQNSKNGTKKKHVELSYSVAINPQRKKVEEVIISNLPKLPG